MNKDQITEDTISPVVVWLVVAMVAIALVIILAPNLMSSNQRAAGNEPQDVPGNVENREDDSIPARIDEFRPRVESSIEHSEETAWQDRVRILPSPIVNYTETEDRSTEFLGVAPDPDNDPPIGYLPVYSDSFRVGTPPDPANDPKVGREITAEADVPVGIPPNSANDPQVGVDP